MLTIQSLNIPDLITTLTSSYKEMGYFTAILICFSEAFLPVLPLSAFVVANSATYGLFEGLFLSSLGSILGAWSVYSIFYFIGNSAFLSKYKQKKFVDTYTTYLKQHGFLIISLLCMLPVFPNSLITVTAGLIRMNFKQFASASALGIIGLNVLFSLVGSDLEAVFQSPMKLCFIISAFIFIQLLGMQLKKRLA